jgi:hypothetical protein
MPEWEYSKIDLNDLPRKAEDVDLLNDVGAQGWEIIAITSNNIAYLKRQIGKPTRSSRSPAPTTR